jgi:uncharacterized protein (TIGR02452 family)
MSGPVAAIYQWRIAVWKETEAAAHAIGSPPTLKFTPAQVRDPVSHGYATVISVRDADCIDVAKEMQDRGLQPVVLNLSDDCVAGGVVDLGSGAQEESLWRRTALSATQHQGFYPLCEDGRVSLLYSPAVPVLRDTEERGYAWLPTPFYLDFIACPALKYPHWVSSATAPDGDLSDSDKERLATRLRLILRVAAQMGNDAVVLGPMGCGAWRNPPGAVAGVFATVLPEFDGVFREIVVAALTTRAGFQTTNAAIFTDVLMSARL